VTLYPHVVLGLAGNRFEDECRAVDLVAARGVGAISFVVFMPLRGTPLESAPPPGIDRIASVLAYARERMPEAVQALGCARPRTAFGERVEAVALLAGVTRLAVPTLGAERAAAELELAVTRQESCCSIDLFEPCTGR
jgi:uncharacterized radical SAM superfamily protein